MAEREHWNYEINLNAGEDGDPIIVIGRRLSLTQQDIILGFIDMLGTAQSRGDYAQGRLIESDIIIHALDLPKGPEGLTALETLLGEDPDLWPIRKSNLLNGIFAKERAALLRSRGMKPDGAFTEKTQRLVALEELRAMCAGETAPGGELVDIAACKLRKEVAVGLGLWKEPEAEKPEGEQSGPPPATSVLGM